MVAAMTRRGSGRSDVVVHGSSLVRAADLPGWSMTSGSRSALPDVWMADGTRSSSGRTLAPREGTDDLSRPSHTLPFVGGLPGLVADRTSPGMLRHHRRAGRPRTRRFRADPDVAAGVAGHGGRGLTASTAREQRAAPGHGSTTSQPVAATHRRAAQRASPKQRLGVRHVCSQFDRWSASFVESRLQPGDQLLGLVAGELAGGLALRETHRSTGIPEVLVARSPEKRQQFAHLT